MSAAAFVEFDNCPFDFDPHFLRSAKRVVALRVRENLASDARPGDNFLKKGIKCFQAFSLRELSKLTKYNNNNKSFVCVRTLFQHLFNLINNTVVVLIQIHDD